jgi:hypothetical protein
MSMVGCYCAIDQADLDRLIEDPDGLDAFLGSVSPASYIDVDKEWEAIHFILNGGSTPGGSEPLASVVYGGSEFGPDYGYGPRRFHTPALVADIAKALAAFTPAEVEARYSPEDMDEVYPDGEWSDPESDFDLEGLQHQFTKLRNFYAEAAKRDQCVVLWIG